MERIIFFRKLLIPITILLWGSTLFFRLPYIDKTPAVNNVAHLFMLKCLDIWQEEGPLKSHFTMKHTYPGEANKYITYYKRFQDKNGNNYYVSHPPLAQILAWITTGFGHFRANNQILSWFAILIHLAGAIVLQLLVRGFFNNSHNSLLTELVAVVIFLFHPILLYLFTFHYFAESVGLFFFLVMLFGFFQQIQHQKKLSTYRLITVFLVSFLFSLAEWLGPVLSVSLLFVTLFKPYNNQIFRKTAFISLLGSLAAILVFVFQHITLNNFSVFIKALGIRFLERSGFFGIDYTDMGYAYNNLQSYVLLLKQLYELVQGIGIIIFILLLFYIFQRKKIHKQIPLAVRFMALTSLLAGFFYFIGLFSASITHYIYAAKWIIPMLLYATFPIAFTWNLKYKTTGKITLIGLFVIAIIWSIDVFTTKASILVGPDSTIENYVSLIKKESAADECIYVALPDSGLPATTIIWLSYSTRRNIANSVSAEQICKSEHQQGRKYIFFCFENKRQRIYRGKCSMHSHVELFPAQR